MSVRFGSLPKRSSSGLRRAHVIGPRAECRRPCRGRSGSEERLVVIAERAGMDLHHHAVLHAHGRHLGEHLGAEQFRIFRAWHRPTDTRRNRASAAALERSAVLRCRVAVIGGGRAIIAEEGAPVADAPQDSRSRWTCRTPSSRRSARGSARNPSNSGSTTGSGR